MGDETTDTEAPTVALDAPTDAAQAEPAEQPVQYGDTQPEPASEPDPTLPGADQDEVVVEEVVVIEAMPDDWWTGTRIDGPDFTESDVVIEMIADLDNEATVEGDGAPEGDSGQQLPDSLTVDFTQDQSADQAATDEPSTLSDAAGQLVDEHGQPVDLGEPVAVGDVEPQPFNLTDEERAALPPLDTATAPAEPVAEPAPADGPEISTNPGEQPDTTTQEQP